VLNQVERNTLKLTIQNHELASYFGKRVPEDGQINWSWQKERIRNWVRALTFPYPGAFTFFDGVKIIIDEVEFVNIGFNYNSPDGMIMSINPLLVKTPNGVIALKKVRTNLPDLIKTHILS
jgi:methionyl-tRNA formyltransferase